MVLAACGGEAPTIGAVQSSAQPEIYHSVWHGAGADANGGDAWSNFWVAVRENAQAGAGRYLYLDYSRNWVDPTSEVCETIQFPRCKCRPDPETGECPPCPPFEWCRFTRYGWEYGGGEIDPSAFRASGSGAALDVTVTPSPTFWMARCDVDELAGTYDCTEGDGAGGAIAIAWKKNGLGGWSNSGTSSGRYGAYSYHYNGTTKVNAADVSGAAFELSAASGSFGTGTNVTVNRSLAQ
jgi:hypothetical protein